MESITLCEAMEAAFIPSRRIVGASYMGEWEPSYFIRIALKLRIAGGSNLSNSRVTLVEEADGQRCEASQQTGLHPQPIVRPASS